MKKIILACVATILSLSFVNAQEETAEDVIMSENMEEEQAPEPRSILLGVTAGVNMTTYSGDVEAKMGLGGQVGINCDIPIGQYLSIMPELIFAYKTVKIDDLFEAGDALISMESTDKLLYMNVPIHLKGSISTEAGRPFIAVGPMINVGLYGVNKMGDYKMLLFQSDPDSDIEEIREDALYNVLDFSVNLKAGFDFDFGLSISAAFQLGLTNMYKMTDERKLIYKELGMKTPSQKSQTISVSLGYSF